ncbi:MAG: hypothetical protein IJS73_07245 [Paludibacteraceae bacterium]|nr:hypothetical protein [Paludibacteraceae bacterium]
MKNGVTNSYLVFFNQKYEEKMFMLCCEYFYIPHFDAQRSRSFERSEIRKSESH